MKVKFANKIYEVLYTKEVAGKTLYAIEDEPNHIDWLVNVEVIDEQKSMKVYRVENEAEQKGLWRKFDGTYEPLFDMLTDGQCRDLPMEDSPIYREGGKKWFASAPSKETLQKWFSKRDLEELIAKGFTISEFEVIGYKKVSDFEYIFTRDNIINRKYLEVSDIYPEQKYVPLKFNVGDWIVYNDTICKIYKTSPDDKFYHCFDSNDCIHIYNRDLEDKMHLWTIEDAKPGDLLDTNGTPFIYKKHDEDSLYFYCGINTAGEFVESCEDDFWGLNYKTYPVTKEQKDLFFLKMKKSGFKWDEEKKELKKFEKQNKQKLIWDKFDDLMLKDLIEFIESGWSGNGKSHLIYWLKSIKDRIK